MTFWSHDIRLSYAPGLEKIQLKVALLWPFKDWHFVKIGAIWHQKAYDCHTLHDCESVNFRWIFSRLGAYESLISWLRKVIRHGRPYLDQKYDFLDSLQKIERNHVWMEEIPIYFKWGKNNAQLLGQLQFKRRFFWGPWGKRKNPRWVPFFCTKV